MISQYKKHLSIFFFTIGISTTSFPLMAIMGCTLGKDGTVEEMNHKQAEKNLLKKFKKTLGRFGHTAVDINDGPSIKVRREPYFYGYHPKKNDNSVKSQKKKPNYNTLNPTAHNPLFKTNYPHDTLKNLQEELSIVQQASKASSYTDYLGMLDGETLKKEWLDIIKTADLYHVEKMLEYWGKKFPKSIKLLLTLSEEVNGSNGFHYAIEKGHFPLVQKFLSFAESHAGNALFLDTLNENRESPVCIARKRKYKAIYDCLIERNFSTTTSPKIEEEEKEQAEIQAESSGSFWNYFNWKDLKNKKKDNRRKIQRLKDQVKCKRTLIRTDYCEKVIKQRLEKSEKKEDLWFVIIQENYIASVNAFFSFEIPESLVILKDKKNKIAVHHAIENHHFPLAKHLVSPLNNAAYKEEEQGITLADLAYEYQDIPTLEYLSVAWCRFNKNEKLNDPTELQKEIERIESECFHSPSTSKLPSLSTTIN